MTDQVRAVRRCEEFEARSFVLVVLRALWIGVRLPVLAVLIVFEPIFRLVLAGLALLFALMAAFYALIHLPGGLPLWGMLACAAGAVMLLSLYYAVLRAFSI
jgi:hypothetical protein